MPLRIGILTNSYPPDRNGVSNAVYGLQQELEKKGHLVFVATPQQDGVDYPSNVLPLVATEFPKSITSDIKLPKPYIEVCTDWFAKQGIDLLHTHDTLFAGIEGAVIAYNLQIPCVHTFHTMIEDYSVFTFPAYNRIIRKGFKEVCNSYNAIISPSQKAYKYLLGLGITTPVTQIFNVSHLKSLVSTPTNKFDFLQSTEFTHTFLTFCRLSPEKGLIAGINLLVPILRNNPKVRYVIAGLGPQEEELKLLIKNFGLQKQILLAGSYCPAELESLQKSVGACAFIFTSASENLPTNVLEGLWLGLPIFAIDDNSVDYVLRDGYNGFKSPIRELPILINEFINKPEFANTLQANAKLSATEFLNVDTADEHIKLYEKTKENYRASMSQIQQTKDDFWSSLKKDALKLKNIFVKKSPTNKS